MESASPPSREPMPWFQTNYGFCEIQRKILQPLPQGGNVPGVRHNRTIPYRHSMGKSGHRKSGSLDPPVEL